MFLEPPPIRWDLSVTALFLEKYRQSAGSYKPDLKETQSLADVREYLQLALRGYNFDATERTIVKDITLEERIAHPKILEIQEQPEYWKATKTWQIVERAAKKSATTPTRISRYAVILKAFEEGKQPKAKTAELLLPFTLDVLKSVLEYEDERKEMYGDRCPYRLVA